jgi:hypothetical protein
MITKTRQNWLPGATVKVGFLRLRVLALIPTPGNHFPDEYALESIDGRAFYRFTPHNGVFRVPSRQAALDLNF